jgi:hypothetical protein
MTKTKKPAWLAEPGNDALRVSYEQLAAEGYFDKWGSEPKRKRRAEPSNTRMPRWAKYRTLDEVSECLSGITAETSAELWSFLQDEVRNPEEDWDPGSWKAEDSNILSNHWRKLSIEAKRNVRDAGKAAGLR